MANELAAQQEKLARQLEENHVLLLDIAEGVTNYIQAQQAAAGESRPIRRAWRQTKLCGLPTSSSCVPTQDFPATLHKLYNRHTNDAQDRQQQGKVHER